MGDRATFAVAVETRADCVIVRVDGELDMANAASFKEALGTAPASAHVVVDLTECTFLDSSGMRGIASALGQAERVSIVAAERGILRGLEISALNTMISIHRSLDDALAPG